MVVLSKVKQLIVLDSKPKYGAVTNEANYFQVRVQKIQGKKHTFFQSVKSLLFSSKLRPVARTSGEMTRLGGERNEVVSGDYRIREKNWTASSLFFNVFIFNFKQGIYGFEKFRNASGFGVIKRTRGNPAFHAATPHPYTP